MLRYDGGQDPSGHIAACKSKQNRAISILINTPLQRGDCGARATELFQQFRQTPRGNKTVKTVLTNLSLINTQLKVGC